MAPEKLKVIIDWPTPKKVKDIQSFLGFANFYRRFIEGYSRVAQPLFALTRKDITWEWDDSCQRAFDDLKAKFISAPVLRLPDTSAPFRIETDASDYATGAILSQQHNEEWHPVAYLS